MRHWSSPGSSPRAYLWELCDALGTQHWHRRRIPLDPRLRVPTGMLLSGPLLAGLLFVPTLGMAAAPFNSWAARRAALPARLRERRDTEYRRERHVFAAGLSTGGATAVSVMAALAIALMLTGRLIPGSNLVRPIQSPSVTTSTPTPSVTPIPPPSTTPAVPTTPTVTPTPTTTPTISPTSATPTTVTVTPSESVTPTVSSTSTSPSSSAPAGHG